MTFTDNANTPFTGFVNNWYGQNDTIGNSGTGSINSRTFPSGWVNITTQSYEVRATTSTAAQSITYQISLTLNNNFGGIDVGASTGDPFVYDICSGHYSPSDISYSSGTVSNDLDVPLLKQTSNPWQAQVYDGANKWSPTSPTIRSWGCALTSAAMVFNYYGINKLPDGSALDPGTLNTWLKNQKDGYVGQGLINWLALSRLSKLAKSINGTNFDALEYRRKNGNSNQLTNDLNAGIPDILKEPGHYVVAKGIDANTFDINDPYYDRGTLSNGYNNTFQNLGSFVKSNTDLSYIMITVNPDISLNIKDSTNTQIGESFIEDSIINPENPSQGNQPIKIYYVPQPENGIYNISITSNKTGQYSIDVYFYDTDGNVKMETLKGTINPQNQIQAYLNFDKNNLNNNNSSFGQGTLINSLKSLYLAGLIDNEGLLNSLIAKTDSVKSLFNEFLSELNVQKGRHLTQSAYDNIIVILNSLL